MTGVLSDPGVDAAAASADLTGVRIAIVTWELIGVSIPGGIGTAYTALAFALAEAGAEVEVFFTGSAVEGADTGRYVDAGIAVHVLDAADVARWAVPNEYVRRAYAAHEWLAAAHARKPYNIVHVPECGGHGGVIAAAKRAGVSLGGATVVCGTHGSSRWVRELNREPFFLPRQLAMEVMERRAVEEADAVLSPSAYLVEDMRSRGWRLPERTLVQQYVTPPIGDPSAAGSAPERIDEVVFFGRLETRKGFPLFMDALDELARRGGHDDLRVTFLGRPDYVAGRPALEWLEARRGAWPFAVQALSDLDQPAAVAYLQGEGRLAVVPSLADNLPLTVIEALSLRVPLIAARTGGIPEVIAAEDLDRCTTEASPDALADAIERALREPPAPPRFAVTPAENREAVLRWHRALAQSTEAPAVASTEDYDLTLADGVRLDDGAEEALVAAGRRAGADIVVFPLVGPDGRIAAPLGGAPELAALAPVISLGSALVRRGLSADEAALAAAILDGARVLTYPSPVGRAAALPDIAGLLEWWPGADEIAAAERAAPLGELATLAALAEAGRTATQTDLATALARIATLEEALDEARDEMRRLQLQLNRRDEELGGLMVALEQERRALRSVTSRRPVKLALKLGDVSKRVPGR